MDNGLIVVGVPAGLTAIAAAVWGIRSAPGVSWTVGVTLAWAGLMFQLLRSDLTWDVGQAPPAAEDVPSGYTESFTLYSERAGGKRTELGHATSRHELNRAEKLRIVNSDLKLKSLPGLGDTELGLQSQMRRRSDGRMDGFETEVLLKDFRFKIVGTVTAGHCLARIESPFFSRRPSFRFPLDESATEVAQQFQNFSLMPDLQLGQSWQVRMIDVQSLLLSVFKNSKAVSGDKTGDDTPVDLAEAPFENQVAEVVGRDTLDWMGRKYTVHVVEIHKAGSRSQAVRSYVDLEGRVLRQEIDGFGSKLIVVRDREDVGPCLFRSDQPGIPHLSREFRGRKIWFSSRAYRAQWDARTSDEKAKLLTEAGLLN